LTVNNQPAHVGVGGVEIDPLTAKTLNQPFEINLATRHSGSGVCAVGAH